MSLSELKDGREVTLKLNWGKYKVPVTFTRRDDTLWLKYPFNKSLTEEFKACLSGMTWHGFKTPPIKQWSCHFNEHNIFQVDFLAGMNPYAKFDASPVEFKPTYPLLPHQIEGVALHLRTKRSIFGYEMGLGKTLMVFEIGNQLKPSYIVWVSTRSALLSVQLEITKWKYPVPIKLMTYDGLKSFVSHYTPGTPAPIFIVGDESHKLKNIMAQRTQSFAYTTRKMREEHDENCSIILMTGTPAPKSPIDWYAQCEIVQPGYLREGSIFKFKERLSISKVKENTLTGGVYPELLSWRDSTDKCNTCGKLKDDFEHSEYNLDRHDFVASINEVEKLYKRMKGLVHVKTKAECLDIPDKIYQKIYCKPSLKTVQLMKLIAATTPGAAQALTLLRELSDGFQYSQEQDGFEQCSICHGTGKYNSIKYIGPEKTIEFIKSLDPTFNEGLDPEDFIIDPSKFPNYFSEDMGADCPPCEGTGQVKKYVKSTKVLKSAKDQAIIDLLEEHEDVGRLVIYAGFTASVNRLCEIVSAQKWNFIKLDGKGFSSSLSGSREQLFKKFQDGAKAESRVCFIGNPGSASTGLTLTASPTCVFYSNSFNGDDRPQAEDRIHRIGLDKNRGARIIDLIHLPTDEFVIENLQQKKKLQDMSMGLILQAVNKEQTHYDYE